MATVAFLGTGWLGSGMVTAACARGDAVRVWNRTPARARALAERGALVCASAGEAVRGADRVHLVLSTDAVVDDVLERAAPGLGSETVVVDHSTVSPRGAAARIVFFANQGRAFLHAPVFMSPEQAKKNAGMMLVSGPVAVYERVRDALSGMCSDVWYMGPNGERAAAFKLFGNAMLVAITAGLADVLTLADGVGIDRSEAHGLFARFKVAGAIDVRGLRMLRGDYEPGFETAMARKDVELMLEMAGERALTVLPAIADRFDELIAHGHGHRDMAVLAMGTAQGTSSVDPAE